MRGRAIWFDPATERRSQANGGHARHATRQRVAAMARAGHRAPAIATATGLCLKTIHRWLRQAGLTAPRGRPPTRPPRPASRPRPVAPIGTLPPVARDMAMRLLGGRGLIARQDWIYSFRA